MTREEAINYAEAIKAKTQEKIEFYRRGRAHAPEVYYSDLAFLSAAISALREQEERRWIPVTERLPESEGTYLVYTERGTVYANHFYTKKVFRDDYVREPQWSQRGKVKVTHWMPLPEPPKENSHV